MPHRIVFFGNGPRGAACLARVLADGHQVGAVVVHAGDSESVRVMKDAACNANLECLSPQDPNRPDFVALLREMRADIFVLAGYSPILRRELIAIPAIMAINTHAGELPGMRGSSPLNWALIEGRSTVTLSIIRVTPTVDGGDVLAERTCQVSDSTTIADLQHEANRLFPELLAEVLEAATKGAPRGRVQEENCSAYYPLRFPDDGLILWDQLTATQIHNRIRALTVPYPGAFTFGRGRRIRLLASEMAATPFKGDPGRVYRITPRGLLVCASDQCIWVTQATDARTASPARAFIERYDRLATMREAAMRFFEMGVSA